MLWTSSSLLWELDRYTFLFQIDKSHLKEAPLLDERHTLAPVFARTERVALLFKGAAEAAGTLEFLETPPGILSLLHRAMVLLQPLLQIFAGTMFHFPPERFPDSLWLGGVFIRGDLLRCVTHGLQALLKEGFGRFQITSLAQAYIDQVAELIDSSIQIAPVTIDSDGGLIYVPLVPDLGFGLGFQCRSPHRSEALFPRAHGLVGQLKATSEEHFGQIPQTQCVAQSPENDEKDDLSWRVHIIEGAAGSFNVGTLAGGTIESCIATFRLLRASFRLSRLTKWTCHRLSPLNEYGCGRIIWPSLSYCLGSVLNPDTSLDNLMAISLDPPSCQSC
jgi:hypothetical protein